MASAGRRIDSYIVDLSETSMDNDRVVTLRSLPGSAFSKGLNIVSGCRRHSRGIYRCRKLGADDDEGPLAIDITSEILEALGAQRLQSYVSDVTVHVCIIRYGCD